MTPSTAFVWSIAEAARRAGVSAGTIRLWEAQGLIEPPRSRGGARRFDEGQIRRLERIAYLKNVNKLDTASIKDLLSTEEPRAATGTTGGTTSASAASYGARLRRIRKEQGFTLAAVAAGTRLSTSFVSALERDQVGASVNTLRRILTFYGTTETALLTTTSGSGGPGVITRTSELCPVADAFRTVSTTQLLPVEAAMGASLTTVEPGGGSRGSYTHDGEEFVFVMSGIFQITLAEEHYELREGDCLHFASTIPHAWLNPFPEPTRMIWVGTPATY